MTDLTEFKAYLVENEKRPATVEKYLRDVGAFLTFAGEQPLNRELVLAYKKSLLDRGYLPASINSMLASLNAWLRFAGREGLRVKQLRIQREIYCPEEKELTREEYVRLVRTAQGEGNERLALLLQTICATGIRISELQFITLEAVQRGKAQVLCKGKYRTVFLVSALCKKLKSFARRMGIRSGVLFVSSSGRPLDRSNIWRWMKALCVRAGVAAQKVFPHNLRHLFAREFYSREKDIAKLADILGHANIGTTRIYILTTGFEHRRKLENMRLIL